MPVELQPHVKFGKYTLVASLGRGGMAEIFLAREQGRLQFVVIKRILQHLTGDLEFVEMLLSEAKVASLLGHPGIVRILELGREDGRVYLAMEYVAGWNVLALSKAAGGKVPPPVAARIGRAVAEALGYAHRCADLEGRPLRIVHRDVTPSNVMVTPAGEVKLIDFGIAKAATQIGATAPGIVKGKLRFLAPEQVTVKPVDGRTDIFSLGVSLYEITTGTQPFGRPGLAATVDALCEHVPPAPHLLVPGYPPALEAVITRALEKDPDHRFPDASAMAAALAEALRSMPDVDLGGWAIGLAAQAPDLLPPPYEMEETTLPAMVPAPTAPRPPAASDAARPTHPRPPRDLRPTVPLPALTDLDADEDADPSLEDAPTGRAPIAAPSHAARAVAAPPPTAPPRPRDAAAPQARTTAPKVEDAPAVPPRPGPTRAADREAAEPGPAAPPPPRSVTQPPARNPAAPSTASRPPGPVSQPPVLSRAPAPPKLAPAQRPPSQPPVDDSTQDRTAPTAAVGPPLWDSLLSHKPLVILLCAAGVLAVAAVTAAIGRWLLAVP